MLKSADKIRARLARSNIVWTSASGSRPGKKTIKLDVKRSDELLRQSAQSTYAAETIPVYGVTVLESKTPVDDLFETLEINESETSGEKETSLPEVTKISKGG